MLDGTDKETIHALHLLTDVASRSDKPLVLWLGAGTSKWCGYPLWRDLADTLHSKFQRYEASYDASAANLAIELERYPDLFQQCKDLKIRPAISPSSPSL